MVRRFKKAPGICYLCLNVGGGDRTIHDGEILVGDQWANFLGEGLVELKMVLASSSPKAKPRPPARLEDSGGVTRASDVLSAASLVGSGRAKKVVVGGPLPEKPKEEEKITGVPAGKGDSSCPPPVHTGMGIHDSGDGPEEPRDDGGMTKASDILSAAQLVGGRLTEKPKIEETKDDESEFVATKSANDGGVTKSSGVSAMPRKRGRPRKKK